MKNSEIRWSCITKDISDLIKNGYNPRKISNKEKEDLQKSITEFGRVIPIILNTGSRENTIIGGEQRMHIYRELGYKKIECMIPDRELSIEEEKELNLRLNYNGGSWNESLLKEFDMDMLLDIGFGDDELQGLFDDIELLEDGSDAKEILKEAKEIIAATGDIWELGNHRLLVGDSTDIDSVTKLMQDDLADIIWCDPPYNIGLDYSKGTGGNASYQGSFTKADDSKKYSDYLYFIHKSMEVAKVISKEDAHYFYWSDAAYIGMMQGLMNEHGIKPTRVCMWIKNNQNPTYKIAFNKVYEPCTYGVRGKPFLNTNMNNLNEVLNQEIGAGNIVHDEISEMIDLWLVRRDDVHSYLHPTQKPVTLNEKPLKRCSAPGHIVFSGFGGSGSDLIACESLNRKWRGVEQDPTFATIIIKRWEEFTGKKAKRILFLLNEIRCLNHLNLNTEVKYSFKGWAGSIHYSVFKSCVDFVDGEINVYSIKNKLLTIK